MATRSPLGDQTPMVGYRFHPTDRELIIDYLEPKLRGVKGDNPIIAVAEVYKFEPWDLRVRSKIKSKDQVWYFLCSRQQKFKKSKRFNRKTEEGYWKSDGKPRPIKAKGTKEVIGTKRTLIFHIGHPKGIRTKWVMHEYECIPGLNVAQQADFVLCKLQNKSDKKYGRDDTNHQVAEASNSLNEKPDGMASVSSQDETVTKTTSENLDGMTMSSYKIVEPSHLVYDPRDRNPSVTTTTSENLDGMTMSSYEIGEPSHLVYDPRDRNPSVTTTTSDLAGDGSDSSFLVSSPENQHLSGLSVVASHGIDVSNTPLPSDSEYRDLDMQDGISISVEDEWSPVLAVTSTDFGMQNQHENSDMSSFDGLMISDLESRDEPEVVPESSAECRALPALMRQEAEIQNSSPWIYSDQSSSWLLPPVEQDLLDTYYYLCDIELPYRYDFENAHVWSSTIN